MAERVCPWWIGYLLASPLRRLLQDPHHILSPYVRHGMTVLEPGPAMGFFTLELADLVGPKGRVVAVDIQPRMLAGLRRRLERAGLLERVDIRQARPDSMAVDDLQGEVDFILAFAMVHEFPDGARFFAEAHRALKAGGKILISEPMHHVNESSFGATLDRARGAGFQEVSRPRIRRNLSALLVRG